MLQDDRIIKIVGENELIDIDALLRDAKTIIEQAKEELLDISLKGTSIPVPLRPGKTLIQNKDNQLVIVRLIKPQVSNAKDFFNKRGLLHPVPATAFFKKNPYYPPRKKDKRTMSKLRDFWDLRLSLLKPTFDIPKLPKADIILLEPGKVSQNSRMRAEIMQTARKSQLESIKYELNSFISPNRKIGYFIEPNPKKLDWWDATFLGSAEPLESNKIELEVAMIVQGNVKIPENLLSLAEKNEHPNKELPLLLTPKEEKRLRKKQRVEKEEERVEMELRGMVKRRPDKLKMGTFVKSLGVMTSVDPTRAERMVREQVEERQRRHKEHNQKISSEERASRKKEKAIKVRNEARECKDGRLAIFGARWLFHPRTKMKIRENAKKNFLSGKCLMSGRLSIIIVEGTPSQVTSFKRVVLQKIAWDADKAFGSSENSEIRNESEFGEFDKAFLAWEGPVKRWSFKNFKMKEVRGILDIREELKTSNLDYLFRAVRNYMRVSGFPPP